MEYISHRVNTIEELLKIPVSRGVELDLRDSCDRLILQHDPFSDGIDFENYLEQYHHGMMILNIKSERIEYKVLELINKYNVENYFFLDSSFPMINLLSAEGENNIALRFSEYEGLDTIYQMQGKCKWVWVDCFTKLPITKQIELDLRAAGFKLCLVSPELQGRQQDVLKYKNFLNDKGIIFDAICTKEYCLDTWTS